jgi:hypothetical protein
MQFAVVTNGVDEQQPLIYMWEIRSSSGHLIGRYVGKAKAGSKRPRNDYSRNVANALAGKPYRKGKASAYRRVHHALAEAHRLGNCVTLSFLCNVQPGENINQVEQRCIGERSCKGSESWQLNG